MVLPVHDINPVRRTPWVTCGASGAGSVAYLAHVFGFLTGVVVGLIVRATSPPPQYPVHPRLSQV